ncbi:hypothetical protein EDB89DRAFT_1922174 [Lactarius sanguifluus]|nr:hypothetical protein EDB89DRAFT_1922174 [Lactarius sanguifluus]
MASKTPSYLQPTASTARRAASSAPSKRAQPHTRRRPPPKAPQPTLGDGVICGDSKVPTVESQSAPTTQPSRSHPAEDHAPPPGQIYDSLQIAAQVQSWLFMRSNLQETLASVRQSGQDSSDALAEAISSDSNPERSRTARSGSGEARSWLQLQADLMQVVALLSQLPMPSQENLQKLKACLDGEASRVASLLKEVDLWNNETSSVHHTLAQLYPILRARSDNIKIASDIIECSIDSIRV